MGSANAINIQPTGGAGRHHRRLVVIGEEEPMIRAFGRTVSNPAAPQYC